MSLCLCDIVFFAEVPKGFDVIVPANVKGIKEDILGEENKAGKCHFISITTQN